MIFSYVNTILAYKELYFGLYIDFKDEIACYSMFPNFVIFSYLIFNLEGSTYLIKLTIFF